MSNYEIGEYQLPRPKWQTLEEYSEELKDVFMFKREDGILQATSHTNQSEPVQWGSMIYPGFSRMFRAVGQDLDTEVLIVTGYGENWIGKIDLNSMTWLWETKEKDPYLYSTSVFNWVYRDTQQNLEGLINNLNIPTIGVLNGPSDGHYELACACDITLAADDCYFQDIHFVNGLVPGDGVYLTMKHFMGEKRANWLALTGERIDAQTALEWGYVSEVLPRDQLLPRAWEIARKIMEQPRVIRRMTHDIMKKPLRKMLADDHNMFSGFQAWGNVITGHRKDDAAMELITEFDDSVMKDSVEKSVNK